MEFGLSHEGSIARLVVVREIDGEKRRFLQLVPRGTGPVVTWHRSAQMVLPPARGMDVAASAEVASTRPDWVCEVLHNFNDD